MSILNKYNRTQMGEQIHLKTSADVSGLYITQSCIHATLWQWIGVLTLVIHIYIYIIFILKCLWLLYTTVEHRWLLDEQGSEPMKWTNWN